MPPSTLQTLIWSGSLFLSIHLSPSDSRSYDASAPYLIHFPRLSYLAFLLPRLHAFFSPELINPEVALHEAWFECEGVGLKWHYPLGLLYDLYSGAEAIDPDSHSLYGTGLDDDGVKAQATTIPWKLTLHYSDYPTEHLLKLDPEGRTMRDMFINSVKEADFVRNGSGRAVMGLGKEDSDGLWGAVQHHDLQLFNEIQNKLLHPPGMVLRHIPMKVYLPTSSSSLTSPSTTRTTKSTTDPIPEEQDLTNPSTATAATPTTTAHLRVVQSLIPLYQPDSQQQPHTLGTALNNLLPTIFPSKRSPIFARPVLHGVAVPLGVKLEELMLKGGGYGDGWVHLGVRMMG